MSILVKGEWLGKRVYHSHHARHQDSFSSPWMNPGAFHSNGKYTGFIVVAAFLLSILVGVFWNEIIQADTIAIGAGIIFCLLGLFFFLYTVGRILFYGDHIDWSKPNILVRPFLPPFGSENLTVKLTSEVSAIVEIFGPL